MAKPPVPQQHDDYLLTKILIGVIGAVLSLALHELFHIAVHWGHITHVSFFPNPWTIVQLAVDLPPGYDIDGEEMVAYMITFIVILITAMIIFHIHDHTDKRSSAQLLFPKDADMRKLSPEQMLELSGLANTLSAKQAIPDTSGTQPKPKRTTRKKRNSKPGTKGV